MVALISRESKGKHDGDVTGCEIARSAWHDRGAYWTGTAE